MTTTLLHSGFKPNEQVREQVVGHGPGRADLLDLQGDGVGLVHADPDRAAPIRDSFSLRITMGMLVTGSIINPRIFISTSIVCLLIVQ